MNFLLVFKYSNYLPSCKNQKKLYAIHSWEKCPTARTDRKRDSQMDRQKDKGDFIGHSVEQGSKVQYNPNKKKENIPLDDMIVDMLSNKKCNPTGTELFIRGRKLNISLVVLQNFILKFQKNTRLNSTYFFIMRTLNKREPQQIETNHFSDIDFKT